MAARRALGLTFLAMVALGSAGCPATAQQPEDLAVVPQRCVPGETRVCTCLGGGEGTQSCQSDGRRYNACVGCPGGTDLGEAPPPIIPDGAVPSGSPCGECDGCCDGTTCVATASQSRITCGQKSDACHGCATTEICVQGTCVVDTGTCSTASCAGCCSGNACITPDKQSWTLCGSGGNACFSCPYGVKCNAECTDDIDPSASSFFIRVNYVNVALESWDYLSAPDILVCFGGGAKLGCARPCGNDEYTCTAQGDLGRIKDANGNSVAFSGATLRAGVPIAVWDEDYPDANDLIGNGALAITKKQASYSTGPFVSVVQLTFEIN